MPYKAKRVYFDKKLKIINFLFFTQSSTTFYSASDGVILFQKFNQLLIKLKFESWVYCTSLSKFKDCTKRKGVSCN